MARRKSFGKRKFTGNRYTRVGATNTDSNSSMNVSASEKKIDLSAAENDELECNESKNIIIQLDLLLLLLNSFAKCKNCGRTETFDVIEEENNRKGLAVSLMYLCTACGHSTSTMSSKISKTLSIVVTDVLLAGGDIRPYVLQGEPATLTCHYVLEPSEIVTEVEWEKDGALVYLWTLDNPPEDKDVLRGKVDLSVKSPSTLAITEVHMDMQGTYTCRVRTNGKYAHNEMFLMVIVDACDDSAWKTHSDMIHCTETINMHCVGIFPKPSPACGVYSERTGKYLSSVPFDSVNVLFNRTYEVSFNRRFLIQDWINNTDISFRCYMVVLGTPWRSGITHKMFGDPGCEKDPPHIENGYYNITEERSCWGFPGEGARAEYYCENGYQLLGTALYTCSSGDWKPEGVLVDKDYEVPICSDGSGAGGLSIDWLAVLFFTIFSIRIISS